MTHFTPERRSLGIARLVVLGLLVLGLVSVSGITRAQEPYVGVSFGGTILSGTLSVPIGVHVGANDVMAGLAGFGIRGDVAYNLTYRDFEVGISAILSLDEMLAQAGDVSLYAGAGAKILVGGSGPQFESLRAANPALAQQTLFGLGLLFGGEFPIDEQFGVFVEGFGNFYFNAPNRLGIGAGMRFRL